MRDAIKTTLVLIPCLLAACAATAPVPPADQQQIRARYERARDEYRQKMAPLAQYFVKTCSPLPDPDYLACIERKREEIAELSIYPETADIVSRRQILEQQLLQGQIDRKQFRASLESLRLDYEAAQLQRDLASGRYNGRY